MKLLPGERFLGLKNTPYLVCMRSNRLVTG